MVPLRFLLPFVITVVDIRGRTRDGHLAPSSFPDMPRVLFENFAISFHLIFFGRFFVIDRFF